MAAAFPILATAETYYSFDPNHWNVADYDANKTWGENNTIPDSNLCWAAAASNILAWDNWGTTYQGITYNTGSSIFGYFKGYWTNQGSWPRFGWK